MPGLFLSFFCHGPDLEVDIIIFMLKLFKHAGNEVVLDVVDPVRVIGEDQERRAGFFAEGGGHQIPQVLPQEILTAGQLRCELPASLNVAAAKVKETASVILPDLNPGSDSRL